MDKINLRILKDNLWIFILLVILFMATYKYVAYPEPYTFETSWDGERIELGENIVVQDIIIDEKSRWYGEAYLAIYFSVDSPVKEGTVYVSLSQNQSQLSSCAIPAQSIVSGFYTLKDMNYSKLGEGMATLEIKATDLDGSLYLGTVPNIYNLPNSRVNGQSVSYILAQKCHFYFLNSEFTFRQLAFAIFVGLNFILLTTIINQRENKRLCNICQLVLIVSYICLIFIYNNIVILSSAWAEAVTNFMHNAINVRFRDNILIADSGYLPLFQRLLTLFIIRILNVRPYYAVYMMQFSGYIITGYIMSFFVKYPFRKYFSLKYRYILCLLILMQTFHINSSAFINFIGYGILIIFLYILSDSSEWNRREFICFCLWGFLMCLSKGSYVTLLPYFTVCLLLFFKRFQKRDLIFGAACMLGAALQLVYYIYAGFDWIDRTNASYDSQYILKIFFSLLLDTPNNLLAVFEGNISVFSGGFILITIGFWLVIIFWFYKEVLMKIIKSEEVDADFANLFMMLIYIMAQSLFFRITVRGVKAYDIISDEFWGCEYREIGDKYQMFIYMAIICFFIIVIRLFQKSKNDILAPSKAVLLFMACLVLSNSRFQLKGLGNDMYSSNRAYFSQGTAETILLKKIEDIECRFVPIQPDTWTYSKNANCYYFGRNIFNWSMNTQSVPEALNSNFSSGFLDLTTFATVNSDCGIWQVFVARPSLINNKIYRIVLKDKNEDVLLQMEQDNTNYQKIVSFTFDKPVRQVATVEIIDVEGKRVSIQNGIYIVTSKQEQFLQASDENRCVIN